MKRLSSLFQWLPALLVLAAAAAYLGYGLLSYPAVRAFMDRLAPDGQAAGFTVERFHDTQSGGRLAGAACLALAGVLLTWRRRLWPGAQTLLAGLREDLRQWRTARSWRHAHAWSLAVIVLAALALRASFLSQPIRYDEAITYTHFASKNIARIVSDYSSPNNHILHSLLMHGATRVFGGEEWAIRLPALVFGVLAILLTYAAAARYFSRDTALLAAALVAVSSPMIEYSVNGRGYTMLATFFLALLWVAHRWAKEGYPRDRAYFVLLSVAGLYTVPIMLYPIAVASVVFLVPGSPLGSAAARARKILPALALAALMTAVLYSPAIFFSGPQALLGNRFVAPVADPTAALGKSFLGAWRQWQEGWPLPLTIVVSSGVVVALIFARRISHSVWWLFGGVVACLLLALAQRGSPPRRIWLFLAPCYFMMAAAGLVFAVSRLAAARRWLAPLLAAVLGSVGAAGVLATQTAYYSEETGTSRDAQAMARFLTAQLRPDDAVMPTMLSDAPLRYYCRRLGHSLHPFEVDMPKAGRLFVVCENESCTWEDILRADPRRRQAIARWTHGAPLPRYGPAERVWRGRWGVIYSINLPLEERPEPANPLEPIRAHGH
jgi:hypothetical protein